MNLKRFSQSIGSLVILVFLVTIGGGAVAAQTPQPSALSKEINGTYRGGIGGVGDFQIKLVGTDKIHFFFSGFYQSEAEADGDRQLINDDAFEGEAGLKGRTATFIIPSRNNEEHTSCNIEFKFINPKTLIVLKSERSTAECYYGTVLLDLDGSYHKIRVKKSQVPIRSKAPPASLDVANDHSLL